MNGKGSVTAKIGILLFLFLSVGAVIPQNTEAAWWNSSYDYCINLTIPTSKVAATQTHYPTLAVLNSSVMTNYASIQSAGEDIRIINAACFQDGEIVPYEIEKWNATGNSFIWFDVATLSNTSNTIYSVYYGNPTASDGQNVTGVWDANYIAVWHFNETSGNIIDSTSNNCDGTLTNTVGRTDTSKVDGGILGTAAGYFTGAPLAPISLTGNKTIEVVLKSDGTTTSKSIIGAYKATSAYLGYGVYLSDGANVNKLAFYTNTGGSWQYSNTALTTGVWASMVIAHDGTVARFYKDGVADGTPAVGAGSGTNPNNNNILANPSNGENWNGSIDELRISNIARSASWINQTYLSENNAMITYGTEESTASSVGVAITQPTNTTTASNTTILTFSNSSSNLSCAEYSVNGAANVTNYTLTQSTWTFIPTYNQGSNNITVYVNNSEGDWDTKTTWFTYDTVKPTATINTPSNSSFEVFNFTTSETPSCIYYSINNGANVTNCSIVSNIWTGSLSLADGYYNITVWLNDTAGNSNQTFKEWLKEELSVTLTSPANLATTITNLVNFKFTPSSTKSFTSCGLYVNETFIEGISTQRILASDGFADAIAGTNASVAWVNCQERGIVFNNNKLYLGYTNNGSAGVGQIAVIEYDYETEAVTTCIVAEKDNPNDHHSSPSISFDSTGRMYVTSDSHNDDQYLYQSIAAGDLATICAGGFNKKTVPGATQSTWMRLSPSFNDTNGYEYIHYIRRSGLSYTSMTQVSGAYNVSGDSFITEYILIQYSSNGIAVFDYTFINESIVGTYPISDWTNNKGLFALVGKPPYTKSDWYYANGTKTTAPFNDTNEDVICSETDCYNWIENGITYIDSNNVMNQIFINGSRSAISRNSGGMWSNFVTIANTPLSDEVNEGNWWGVAGREGDNGSHHIAYVINWTDSPQLRYGNMSTYESFDNGSTWAEVEQLGENETAWPKPISNRDDVPSQWKEKIKMLYLKTNTTHPKTESAYIMADYQNDSGGWFNYADNTSEIINGSINEINYTLQSGENTYIWNIYCIDSAGYSEFASGNFTLDYIIDVIPPNTTWNPSTTATGTINQDYILGNCTLTDENIDTRFWNNGTSNSTTFLGNDGTNFWFNMTGLPDGAYTAYCGSNDTTGNYNETSTKSWTKDTVEPTIYVYSPSSSIYTTTSISLQYGVSETASWIGYSLNGAANTTLSGNTTITATQGSNNIIVCGNDTAGNMNCSAVVYFSVDSVHPGIVVFAPTGQYNNTAAIPINFWANDTNRDSCWYNYGTGNISLPSCSNTTISVLNGTYTIIVYVNDTFGNGNSSSSSFESGYNYYASPVTHYNFNSNVLDTVGSNDGAAINMEYFENRGKFNGTGYVRIDNSTSSYLVNEFTYSIWFRPNDTVDSTILTRMKNASYSSFDLYIDTSILYWDLRNATNSVVIVTTPFTETTDFSNLIITYDGSSTSVYINGILKNTTTVGSLDTTVLHTLIGAWGSAGGGYSSFFYGQMDEFWMYNKSLSSDEVTDLYNRIVKINASTDDGLTYLNFNVTFTNTTTIATYNNYTALLEDPAILPSGSNTLTVNDFLGLYNERIYTRTISATTGFKLQAYLSLSGSTSIINFVVIDAFGSGIYGATVTAYAHGRLFDSKTTDSSGGVSFDMDTATEYTLVFSKSGYTTFTAYITPTNPPYTIQLQVSGSGSSGSDSGPVYYQFYPGSALTNSTQFLAFLVNATGNDLDYFGLIISYGGYTDFINGSLSGGIANVSADLSGITSPTLITLRGYYKTLNGSLVVIDKDYMVYPSHNSNNTLITAMVSLGGQLDPVACMILSALISTGVILLIHGAGVNTSYGLGFVGICVLGFFTYLTWFPLSILVILGVLEIALYVAVK